MDLSYKSYKMGLSYGFYKMDCSHMDFLKVARDGANLVSLFNSFFNFAPL